MLAVLPDVIDQLLTAYRNGHKLALLFDYDGTLVAIVEHPRLAEIPSGTRWVLEQLARQPRLFLGLVSGRGLDDLKAMAGFPDFYYAGLAGLELDLRGARVTHPRADQFQRSLPQLAEELQALTATFPGAWVENKELGLTVHFRAVAPHLCSALQENVVRAVLAREGQFRYVSGPLALEITPALNWNKGTALRTIIAHLGPATVPLYAGDQANDEEALQAAADLGGVALGIGPNSPAARYHLQSPAQLTEFLADFLKALESLGG